MGLVVSLIVSDAHALKALEDVETDSDGDRYSKDDSFKNSIQDIRAQLKTISKKQGSRMRNQKTHQVTLCTIIGNEAPYLVEWIAYHNLLGVTKFVLYDLLSKDGSRQVVSPLVRSGLVDWIPQSKWQPNVSEGMLAKVGWESLGSQLFQIETCRKHSSASSTWMLVIDPDEFIIGDRPFDNFIPYLQDHAKLKHGGIYFQRLFFGTNGHVKPAPDELPLEASTNLAYHTASYGKLITLNDATIPNTRSVHHASFKRDNMCVDVEGILSPQCTDPRQKNYLRYPVKTSPYYIAHFVTRSLDECYKRNTSPGLSTWRILKSTRTGFCDGLHQIPDPSDHHITFLRDEQLELLKYHMRSLLNGSYPFAP